ncbi:MAG: adenosine deaminase [Anaerolineales bacterium]|nr:adenosine deaminase [Anaerolineales bacterium]
MTLETFIQAMPKVELHVHLEGSIRPETLLKLAERHGVDLPAKTVEGLRDWYTFTDFPHFIEVYLAVSACLRSPEDIELIAREFLAGQAAQNIRYSEVTYTAFTHYHLRGLSFGDQLAALNRARAWAEAEHGVTMGLVLDIPRSIPAEKGLLTADWAIGAMGEGVVALGLGGPEVDNPPEKFKAAFDRAHAAGLPSVPHAGETVGPESIWGALNELHAVRIGHGVRCLEDPALVDELRARQIPLEVSPTSNVCLKVFPDLARHALPRLLREGLYVTLNSDDPPMFNTTLTEEYLAVARTFQFGADTLEQLTLNAVRASLLPADTRLTMEQEFQAEFARLRAADGVI